MKVKIIIGIFIILILFSVIQVSAYKRLCLGYGDVVPPPPKEPRRTCYHDLCIICTTDDFYPTHPGRCNDLEGCEISGNSTVDSTPPNLTIESPVNGYVYSSRKVLFDIESNEPCSLSYYDNLRGRGRWKKLASNVDDYYRSISFKEGLNSITIKAKDRNDNEIEIIKEFRVDSKKPKIRRTEPRKGYASGVFDVEFSEDNAESLVLHYGNLLQGFHEKELDLGTCTYLKKRYYCTIEVDLDSFDGQEIKYWFVLEDIAGSTHESKQITLKVDATPPVINNDPIFTQDGRYIYFFIDITELNLDEVGYIDYSTSMPRFRRLCSRLKNGICERRKSFRRGHHIVDVQVIDEAGNAVARRIEFDV